MYEVSSNNKSVPGSMNTSLEDVNVVCGRMSWKS